MGPYLTVYHGGRLLAQAPASVGGSAATLHLAYVTSEKRAPPERVPGPTRSYFDYRSNELVTREDVLGESYYTAEALEGVTVCRRSLRIVRGRRAVKACFFLGLFDDAEVWSETLLIEVGEPPQPRECFGEARSFR